ncbi:MULTISPECIES: glycosyltransferase family 9 protein [Eikenella]|uniref:glycosyltransferase family 9 protein n=1 Tax=Eikenella TaxID=538 RepID=UPI0009EDD700|nr:MULTISPECIES: glycosyltransferase family 9 protein [Eikenella]
MSFKSTYKQLKQKWAALRLRIAKTLLDRSPDIHIAELNPHTITGIVFLRQDGKIGDYIVSSFAFREIKRINPNIRIGVICNHKNQAIFTNNPYIDALHVVRAKSTISYYLTARSLAKQYDIAIEPSLVFRPRDLILLHELKCSYNIGLAKDNYKIFNLNITNTQQHYSDIYQQALALCGFSNIDTDYNLPVHVESDAAIQNFLAHHHPLNYTVVNFFGASKARQFNDNNIRHILNKLTNTFPNHHFILLTYPEVTPSLENICTEYPTVFIYKNTSTIFDSIEIIRHSETVITPDTAIIHIASGLNKNIIGLYHDHQQNLTNWHPRSKQAHLIFFKNNINEITPNQICTALQQVFDKTTR